MSTKFYVYGGGRWRELDLNTGRVSGWGSNARLLVARRGRLECARAAPVLRALRALAASEPSRARDGPRLPHFRWDEEERGSHQINDISSCQHCCQHRNNIAVEHGCGHGVTIASALPPPAPLAAPPAPASLPAPPAPAQLSTRTPKEINDIFDKLKKEGLQKPDPSSRRGTIHSPLKRARNKRQRSISASSVDSSAVNDKGANNLKDTQKKEYVRTIRYKGRGRPVRRNSGNVLGIVTLATPKTGLNTNAQANTVIARKTGTSTRDTMSEARHNRDIHNVENTNNVLKQKIVSIPKNGDKQPAPDITRGNQSDKGGETSSDNEDRESIVDDKKIFAYALHNGGCTTMHKGTRWGALGGNTEVSKELVIDEDDVAALRAFLGRHAPDVSLHQFDYDDEYKRGIFYRLNPLVLLERSAEIQKILGADELSLRDFASQLGLRSVSDEPIHRRKQLHGAIVKSGRKRNQPDRYSVLTSTSVNKSPKKKQIVVPPNASMQSSSNKKDSKKEVAQISNERVSKTRPISPPPAPPPRPPSPPRAQPEPRPKKQAAKPARGKGGVINEYSRAEDAAIVTWISSEGRARFVNGNRIWHELQDQFQRLSGHGRTWQSLRNRYLRYILPSLSSLEVPPARAARLRADAATGEIKRKRWPARRNSIFATPGVRGAWSRRPRSPLRTPAPAPPLHSASSSPSPVPNKDAANSSSEDNVRARSSSSSEKPMPKRQQARSSSSEIPRRATRISSGKQMRARRSLSSEAPPRPTHSSVGKLKRARRSSSSEPQPRPKRSSAAKLPRELISTSSETPVRPTRSSMAKLSGVQRSSSTATPTQPTHSSKPSQARRSSSSEPQIRPTRSSTAKLKGARRSSSPAKPPKPSRLSAGKPKQARRSSSSEPETRPTRLSAGKPKQARHSSSSEPESRMTHGKSKQARHLSSPEPDSRPTRLSAGKSKTRQLSSAERDIRPTRLSATNGARRSSHSKKPKRARSSSSEPSIQLIHSSNSSSSSVSWRLIRGPNLRYSDVTRRFARKQNVRHKEESTSSSSAASPPPATKGPRSRRLYNPKAAL